MTTKEIIDLAKKTIGIEAEAVVSLESHVDEAFARIVELIHDNPGRLVVTGIGKSAIIANKIVATLNSTGTPALFMHAADAIHGDLGIVQKHDVVLCISNSGTSPEIKVLIPLVKSMGNSLIAMVGNLKSTLAEKADHILNTTVAREACPNQLTPTSSTTAQLVMGDALAMCLMSRRGFTASDFAKVHPGGALGKKLYLKIADLMDAETAPKVTKQADLKAVIVEISSKRMGATAVVEDEKVVGVITDGDLRRMLSQQFDLDAVTASSIMSASPKTIEKEELAVRGFQLMEKHSITQLLVTDNGSYAGIVHLHDILKEGIY